MYVTVSFVNFHLYNFCQNDNSQSLCFTSIFFLLRHKKLLGKNQTESIRYSKDKPGQDYLEMNEPRKPLGHEDCKYFIHITWLHLQWKLQNILELWYFSLFFVYL